MDNYCTCRDVVKYTERVSFLSELNNQTVVVTLIIFKEINYYNE